VSILRSVNMPSVAALADAAAIVKVALAYMRPITAASDSQSDVESCKIHRASIQMNR